MKFGFVVGPRWSGLDVYLSPRGKSPNCFFRYLMATLYLLCSSLLGPLRMSKSEYLVWFVISFRYWVIRISHIFCILNAYQRQFSSVLCHSEDWLYRLLFFLMDENFLFNPLPLAFNVLFLESLMSDPKSQKTKSRGTSFYWLPQALWFEILHLFLMHFE